MRRILFLLPSAFAMAACASAPQARGSLVGSPETMSRLAAAAIECGYASATLMPSRFGGSKLEISLVRALDASDPSVCLNAWIESSAAEVETIVRVRD